MQAASGFIMVETRQLRLSQELSMSRSSRRTTTDMLTMAMSREVYPDCVRNPESRKCQVESMHVVA